MSVLEHAARRPLRSLLVLLLAAVALGLGIQQPTGLTGKDEYLLGLRVPLEMMQRDAWWIPWVDGAPRLKKPPLMYWLGRASFEAFGPSLAAARGLTVAFSLLLLACTAWLGRRFSGRWQTGLVAVAILLGISGLASESRRFMLDIPVAALSAAALCFWLSWMERPRWPLLVASAALLGAALLTKGPMAIIVFGSGAAAHVILQADTRRVLLDRLPQHAMLLGLALLPPLAWYLSVRLQFPEQLLAAGAAEMEARAFHPSLDPLVGIVTLALPWSFVALHAAWRDRRQPRIRQLAAWLGLSLLPFFFFRSFERYLVGSLIPLALLAAHALEAGTVPAWTRRLGSLVPALLALALCLLLWRFDRGGWWLLAPVLAAFVFIWWQRTPHLPALLLSAVLLWSVGWGIAFPQLGVNAVAPDLLRVTRDRNVWLFDGPQPALLPMLHKTPMRQTSRFAAGDLKQGDLIALRLVDNGRLQQQLQALGVRVREIGADATLASSGSGIKFARQHATWADWRQAWDEHSLDGLKTRIVVFQVK